MRAIGFIALSCVTLLALSGAGNAATGHWYCSADGIKAWTTKADLQDAKGWTYGGDASSYADAGKCAKAP